MVKLRWFGLLVALVGGLAAVWGLVNTAVFTPVTHAAPSVNIITVTTTDDSWWPDGQCSLREALDNANNNLQRFVVAGECPAGSATETDVIVLQGGSEYLLLLPTDQNEDVEGDLDVFANGLPLDLIIRSDDPEVYAIIFNTLDGERVMNIHGATVELHRLVLRQGNTAENGGGILNNGGTLALISSIVQANTAEKGGGLYNLGGTVLITDSTILTSQATSGGGGVYSTGAGHHLSIINSAIHTNATNSYEGGGIFMSGANSELLIANSIIALNEAPSEEMGWGGGVAIRDGVTAVIRHSTIDRNQAYAGGGIFAWGAEVSLVGTELLTNVVSGPGGGGGLFNIMGTVTAVDMTIQDNTALGGGKGGGIYNTLEGNLMLSDSVVQGNTANQYGGGIANDMTETGGIITLTNVLLADNRAHSGAGVANVNSWATLNNTIIRDNIAQNEYGGGIGNVGGFLFLQNGSVVEGNSAIFGGGGIANLGGGQITVQDTAVSGNSSEEFGGGLYNIQESQLSLNRVAVYSNTVVLQGGGGIYNNATLHLGNSTISGNSAPAGYGGGLAADDTGNTTAVNVTWADNGVGLNILKASGTLSLQNSVLSMNGANNCIIWGGGIITSLGGNVASDGSCTGLNHTSDQTADPLLGPLANNGGQTLTHALLAGSPAIGAGNVDACQSTLVAGVDQRGVPRPAASCDSGAFQTQPNRLYLPIITRQ